MPRKMSKAAYLKNEMAEAANPPKYANDCANPVFKSKTPAAAIVSDYFKVAFDLFLQGASAAEQIQQQRAPQYKI